MSLGMIAPVVLQNSRVTEQHYATKLPAPKDDKIMFFVSRFAQVRDVVVCVNGHNVNQMIDMRKGVMQNLGLTAPAAAPTAATNGAGVVNGTVRYRVRWHDASTNTNSIASPILTATYVNNKVTVTAPAAAPARATHWILERTAVNGTQFYPVNLSATNPDGTVIATTTFDDNVDDGTLIQGIVIPNRQAVPARPYAGAIANEGRIFLFGGRILPLIATMTNGSANVADPNGLNLFQNYMVGNDLWVPGDYDGTTYQVATITDFNHLVLNANYTGTTANKQIFVTSLRDFVCWSEPGEPESYGAQTVGFTSNENRIGDDGDPILSACGMGPNGVLYAKRDRLFYHYYKFDPDPDTGDGQIVPVGVRRGALGAKCTRWINGYVYGVDAVGVWRMQPGGEPEDITGALRNDWKNGILDFTYACNWHIGWDPHFNWMYVWVNGVGDNQGMAIYPHLAYIYDLGTQQWIGTKPWFFGVSDTCELLDQNGGSRLCFTNDGQPINGASTQSYLWMDNIGISMGVPAGALMNGNVTGPGAGNNTLVSTGAGWPTGTPGLDLAGIVVVKVSGGGNTRERNLILSNTADTLTCAANWANNPVNGDVFELGPIEAKYRTGRINPGAPERKSRFKTAYAWVKYKSACSQLFVKAYYDNNAYPDFDRALTFNEDGVQQIANNTFVHLDPTALNADGINPIHRYEIPLNDKMASDVQLEFYSKNAGAPWEILGPIKIVADVDDAPVARR